MNYAAECRLHSRCLGMQPVTRHAIADFLHLFYPHHCEGCGTDILHDEQFICTRCLLRLPETGFFHTRNNPVEKIFHGRIRLHSAAAAYYFTKQSLLQHILVQLKYKGNREAGLFLGRQIGYSLRQTEAFADVDALVPLPLHRKKEFTRGYNQAAVISEGIARVWQKPVWNTVVERSSFTETQTRQGRISRWQNMEQVFTVADAKQISDKHLLLVDDVVTTGATLEACGHAVLAVPGTRMSIATAAYTL